MAVSPSLKLMISALPKLILAGLEKFCFSSLSGTQPQVSVAKRDNLVVYTLQLVPEELLVD